MCLFPFKFNYFKRLTVALDARHQVKKCWCACVYNETSINEKLIIWESTEVNFGQKPFDPERLTPPALVSALAPS